LIGIFLYFEPQPLFVRLFPPGHKINKAKDDNQCSKRKKDKQTLVLPVA